MTHAHFGNLVPLRRFLIALVLAVTWCSVSAAADSESSDGWWHHWAVTISGTPANSVTAGKAYSFTPTASGPPDRTLVFSITHKPSWAAFSTSTGHLSGTPTASNLGTDSNIEIAVSDGRRRATLPAFNLHVLAATATTTTTTPAPTISGTPATSVTAGSPYSFTPTASGPSGMTLSYSVKNKPSWATFSIASGLLSGTPSSSQTGPYSGIVISVSDGQASSALPAFSITVNPATVTTGSATVSITPPTQNTNGSTVSNLAGVTIYYGTSSSNLSQSVQVATTTATTYTISNLAVGTWYFGGVAYTSAGMQSAMSPVVSASIQ
jgi:Putative Ig domain